MTLPTTPEGFRAAVSWAVAEAVFENSRQAASRPFTGWEKAPTPKPTRQSALDAVRARAREARS